MCKGFIMYVGCERYVCMVYGYRFVFPHLSVGAWRVVDGGGTDWGVRDRRV